MAQRSEILTVYAAGLIQGVALVTFPAASAIFTSPSDYGLSSTEYGGMFMPQAVMAIISSLLGAGLRKRLGTKLIYFLGLFANLLAMTLLVVSRFVMKEHSLAYAILLFATACMGIGFGFTVPAINTFAAAFFPKRWIGRCWCSTRFWVWELRLRRFLLRCLWDWEFGGACRFWLA